MSKVKQILERSIEIAAGLKGDLEKQLSKRFLTAGLMDPAKEEYAVPLKAGPSCICNSDARSMAALRIFWFDPSSSFYKSEYW
jgi:hypothetical protein